MNRFTHGQHYPIQPPIPNRINGIIGEWPNRKRPDRSCYAIQCEECGLVEVTTSLVMTQMLFNPRHEDKKRRCRECRYVRMLVEFPNCPCHNCADLRTNEYYRARAKR